MNKHFEDARYYLKRAGETASKGVREELEPVEARFRDLTGRNEPEPEPSRLEAVKADLQALQERAEGEAEQAIAEAREKIGAYRGKEPAEA
jgi:hypothetical protein